MLECDRTHVGNQFPCDDSLASMNELLVLVHQAQILFDSWCYQGAGPPLRRGALRGAHGNPDRARTPAWNRVCGAIGSVFSAGRGFGAVLKVFVARSHFIELTFR